MRTVNIEMNVDEILSYCVGPSAVVNDAIGYLSIWNMTYDTVYLYSFKPGEITACYSRSTTGDKNSYIIVAVWDPANSKFSFNS